MIPRIVITALLISQAAFAANVTLKHDGTVKDALKAIAAQAGINLIVIGELKEPMEVHLNDASADDAMATVAAAAKLHVEKSGSIWTVRAMTEEERKATPAFVSPAPVMETKKEAAPEDLEQKLEQIEAAAAKAEAEAAEEQREEARERARDLERLKTELAREQAKLEKRLRKQLKDRRHENDVVKAGSITVAEGQTVGDAVAYGGSVTVLGNVQGKAVAFGGDVHLGPRAHVADDVVSFGGDITKESGAVVGGEELSFGGKTTDVIVNTAVKLKEESDDAEVSAPPSRGGFFGGIGSFFARFAVLFALGFLFTLFAPQRMKSLEAEIKAAPGKSLLTGVLGSIALLPLSVLLAVTVIGIPFIAALWIMAFLGVAMGFAAFASDLGMRLPVFRGKKTQALVLAAGMLALLIVGMIPVLGPTAIVAVGFVSFGAIIRTRFGSTRRLGAPTPYSEIPA